MSGQLLPDCTSTIPPRPTPRVKSDRSKWIAWKRGAADMLLLQASDLWKGGLTVSEIARNLNLKKTQISGLAHRNRNFFPPRPSPIKVRAL